MAKEKIISAKQLIQGITSPKGATGSPGFDHQALGNRGSSLAHPQYALKAGDTFTGLVTLAGGAVVEVDLTVTGTVDLSGVSALELPASGITGAGTGSGLDADKLDSVEGASYLRADVDDTFNEAFGGAIFKVNGGTVDGILKSDPSLDAMRAAGAVVVGSPTGDTQGAGTLNAEGLYVNGVPVATGTDTPPAERGKFFRQNATTARKIDFVPIAKTGTAIVHVDAGTAGSLEAVSVSSTITLDIDTTGANGRDTGSVVTGLWYVYGVYNSSALALIASRSSTPGGATLPSGYTKISRALGVIRVTGISPTVIAAFRCANESGGMVFYWEDRLDFQVLTGGTSTTFAAVNLTEFAPDIEGCQVIAEVIAVNTSTTDRNLLFSLDGVNNFTALQNVSNTTGSNQRLNMIVRFPIEAAVATSVYYKWNGTGVTGGLNFYVNAIILRGGL